MVAAQRRIAKVLAPEATALIREKLQARYSKSLHTVRVLIAAQALVRGESLEKTVSEIMVGIWGWEEERCWAFLDEPEVLRMVETLRRKSRSDALKTMGVDQYWCLARLVKIADGSDNDFARIAAINAMPQFRAGLKVRDAKGVEGVLVGVKISVTDYRNAESVGFNPDGSKRIDSAVQVCTS
jgi:hypothetical protein